MENYVKALLYGFPKMTAMEEGYEGLIESKAVLSYDNRKSGERVLEEIMEEILKKQRCTQLKNRIRGVLLQLNAKERLLLELRFFRRKQVIKEYLKGYEKPPFSSKRSYYRMQAKLLDKLVRSFERAGLTKEDFLHNYADLEEVRWMISHVQAGSMPMDLVDKFFLKKAIRQSNLSCSSLG